MPPRKSSRKTAAAKPASTKAAAGTRNSLCLSRFSFFYFETCKAKNARPRKQRPPNQKLQRYVMIWRLFLVVLRCLVLKSQFNFENLFFVYPPKVSLVFAAQETPKKKGKTSKKAAAPAKAASPAKAVVPFSVSFALVIWSDPRSFSQPSPKAKAASKKGSKKGGSAKGKKGSAKKASKKAEPEPEVEVEAEEEAPKVEAPKKGSKKASKKAAAPKKAASKKASKKAVRALALALG